MPHNAAMLADACVAPTVFALRPDYRAVLVHATDLVPGRTDDVSDKLLTDAERTALARLASQTPESHPHVAAWRDAFAACAKPQRTRSSVEALLRRLPQGLPRIDRITDAYNAVSVAHIVPLGGEDADRYRGAAQLVRATGDEPFDTIVDGLPAIEHPEPGEVVWRDDAGVTCRRWNWRQGVRTRLTTDTTQALFILDALGPLDDEALASAADALAGALRAISPQVRLRTRLLTANSLPA